MWGIIRNSMETGCVKDRPWCGCPWSSTPWQDCFSSLLFLVDEMATFRTFKRYLQRTTGADIASRIVRRKVLKSISRGYINSICILEKPLQCSKCCHACILLAKWWLMVTDGVFHTISLHSIPYYPLHSTDSKVDIPDNRPEAVINRVHSCH